MKPPCNVKPGDRFSFLTVIEVFGGGEIDRDPSRGQWARVRCDCGKRKLVRVRHLRAIKSCGCKTGELITQALFRRWAQRRLA